MISHEFSSRMASRSTLWGGTTIPGVPVRSRGAGGVRSAWSAGYGPLRVEHDAAARLQGARLDPRFLPLGARPRRFRRPLLLSGAGSPRDRRRRECADGGDRGVDRTLFPVFGAARTVRAGALRHQRDAEDRRRRPRELERELEAACGNYRGGDVRGPRPQVSDLGARPVRRTSSRRPPKRCARSRAELGSQSAARNALGARE